MKTFRIRWLEVSAMRCKSWAFGSLLFLEHGNVHLGALFGPWSFDVEVWWPGTEETL